MFAKVFLQSTIASRLPARAPCTAGAIRSLALVLLLSVSSGCIGNIQVLNVEEDEGAIFCTFQEHSWPSWDTGTIRSSDEGATWNRIYPGGANRDAVFVCRCRSGLLAELDDRSWYRSTDRGVSWEPVCTFPAHRTSGPTGRGNSDLVFLGTSDGVMRSTDGGKSWTPADTAGLRHNVIHSIAATSSAVFVVAEEFSSFLGRYLGWGLYRSTDRGRSWANLRDSLPEYFVEGAHKTISPSCIVSDTALFTCANFRAGLRYLCRSGDNGNSWTAIEWPRVIGLFEYDTFLLACVWTDTGGAMLVSADAGQTWNPHGGPPPPGYLDIKAYPSGRGIFAPYLRESVDSTMYRSRDGGRTWEKMRIAGF